MRDFWSAGLDVYSAEPIASAVLGERRTQITAMRLLAGLIDHFGGRRWIPWVFGHPPIPRQLMGRFGASAPLSICKSLLAFIAHDRAGFGGCADRRRTRSAPDQLVGVAPRPALGLVVAVSRLRLRHRTHPDNSPSHRLHPSRAPAAGVCPHRGHRGRTHSVHAIPHRSYGTHRSA